MSNGGSELAAWLKALPNTVKPEVSRVIKVQAERLAGAQRAALAGLLQPPEDSGAGMASIRVEQRNELHQDVLAGGPTTTKGGYDHMLGFEFGTQKQPARPFFYSTAQRLRDSMRTAILEAAGHAMDLRLAARAKGREDD